MKQSYKTSKKMLRPVMYASVVAILGIGMPNAVQAQEPTTPAQEAVSANT